MDVSLLTSPQRLRDVLDEWGIDRARPLIAVGCAPCQGFSSHRKKDPRIDERNSLLVRFGTVLSHLKPDIAIMENVPEIFQEQHWKHFAQWRRTLTHAGYSIRAKIYNLAQFGVPQERFRALIIAARDWRDFAMPAPTHLHTSLSPCETQSHTFQDSSRAEWIQGIQCISPLGIEPVLLT